MYFSKNFSKDVSSHHRAITDTSTKINYASNIYLFKVNNRNTRKRYEICSNWTIKILEWCYWGNSGVIIVNFEHFKPCSSVSIVNFEQGNAGWVNYHEKRARHFGVNDAVYSLKVSGNSSMSIAENWTLIQLKISFKFVFFWHLYIILAILRS